MGGLKNYIMKKKRIKKQLIKFLASEGIKKSKAKEMIKDAIIGQDKEWNIVWAAWLHRYQDTFTVVNGDLVFLPYY